MKRKLKTGINVLLKPAHVNESAIHIQLEPTTACNLACITCAHEDYIKQARHLSLENFIRIIDQIRPQKLTLSGIGEPFANPKLTQMIGYAKQQGADVNTTSNMTLINEALAEKIVSSGLDLIKISIDAATAATYEKIRGEDCHQKLIDGIRLIAEARKKQGADHPAMRLNFVIQGANFTEMAEVVALAHETGVEAIYFQPLELIHLEEKKDELVGPMTKETLLLELKRAAEAAARHDMPTNVASLIKDIDIYWKKYMAVGRQVDDTICPLPWFSLYITVEGDVRPCCSFAVNPEGNMGNILKDDFPAIWNGEKFKKFRQAIRGGTRPFRVCQNCVPRSLRDIFNYSNLLPGYLKGRKGGKD